MFLRPIECVYPEQNTQLPTHRFGPLAGSSIPVIGLSVAQSKHLDSPWSLPFSHAKTAYLRLGLEPTTSGLGGDSSPQSPSRNCTPRSQDLMKLMLFMFRCRRNSAKGKVIGEKLMCWERVTLHRQNVRAILEGERSQNMTWWAFMGWVIS